MKREEIRIGMVVRLKSGGPKMTVIHIGKSDIQDKLDELLSRVAVGAPISERPIVDAATVERESSLVIAVGKGGVSIIKDRYGSRDVTLGDLLISLAYFSEHSGTLQRLEFHAACLESVGEQGE